MDFIFRFYKFLNSAWLILKRLPKCKKFFLDTFQKNFRDVLSSKNNVPLKEKHMGVGGTVLGSLALCLVLALIIEIKERYLN